MAHAILGISAFYHDSAAAILVDGELIAAAQEERFTRKKQDSSFPTNAVKYCLQEAGLKASDLDLIAFYDKPFLKFERLLETYHAFAPKGLKSFLSAAPVWVKEKMFMRRMLREEIEKLDPETRNKKIKFLFPEHHLSHAASAFYPSPFEEAAILTVDGVGEWATTTIGKGKGKEIQILNELPFPHSLGLLYSAFTYYCGFKVNSGEYKLMGLAPYGNHNSEQVRRFEQAIKQELVDIKEDGSILLNLDYFDYAVGLRMCDDDKWQQLFGIARREQESEISQPYMDMALAIQNITEEIILKLATSCIELTGSRNLVMAGGVALNCVANGKLLHSGIIDRLWIQPAAGDAGGALGAALAARHIWLGEERYIDTSVQDGMQGAYLGPAFSQIDIDRMCRTYKAPHQKYSDFSLLCEEVAKLLEQGKIIGWFQGRMEYGPRALGNRSILGDPRHPEMQKRLNLKIKFREGFRPFAPSVLAEDSANYFDLGDASPYMLLVGAVSSERCNPLPENHEQLSMHERLYFLRSDIPAITHVDYSARVQTVHRDTNPRYWQLINAFKQQTGYGLLVNTSFNVRGEPIICTPEDAYRCFMRTEMDYLVIENQLFSKNQQPEWHEGVRWQDQYELD
jgi:carbamoyltransferase